MIASPATTKPPSDAAFHLPPPGAVDGGASDDQPGVVGVVVVVVPEEDDGELGAVEPGAEPEAATVTASFMPPEQWPAVPQMKYLLPGAVRLILVLRSVWVWTELLAEQSLKSDSPTSATLCSGLYWKTGRRPADGPNCMILRAVLY